MHRLAWLPLLSACSSMAPPAPEAPAPPAAPAEIAPHPRALAWSDGALPDGAVRRIGHTTAYPQHWGGVFSPDGRLFAWSDTEHVDIEVVATGERVLHVDARGRHALAFSPDGTRIAALGRLALRVWSIDDAAAVFAADLPHSFSDYSVAHGADAIAVGDWSGELYLFDPDTGELRESRKHPTGSLTMVAYAPSGALVTIGDAGWALWDGDTPTFHARRSSTYAVSTTRDELAYDASNGTVIVDLDGGNDRVLHTTITPRAFSADGDALIGHLADDHVAVVDTAADEITQTLGCVAGRIAVSADGRTIAAGPVMFDLARGVAIPETHVYASPIGFGAHDDLYMRSACALLRYDVASGELLEQIEAPHMELPWSMGDLTIAPSGGRVVSHGGNQWLVVRDVGGDMVASRRDRSSHVAMLADDVVVFADGNRIMRWDLAPDTTTELYSTPGLLHAIAASPDGTMIAVVTDAVEVIDAVTGDLIERRTKLDAVSTAFRDDGTLVYERAIQRGRSFAWERWDVATWTRLAQVPSRSGDWNHSGSSMIAPDGLLAGHVDDQAVLHVVDTTDMDELAALPIRGNYALAPGGRWVAVQQPGGSVAVYDLAR